MKKKLLVLTFFLYTIDAFAYDFAVDNIYYKITSSNTVAVTYEKAISDPYTTYYLSPSYIDSVVIPSSVSFSSNTYSVTSLGDHAFYMCSNLTSITLPTTLILINWLAFYGCDNLSSIYFPESKIIFSNPFSLDNTKWYKNKPDGPVYVGKYFYQYKGALPTNTSINIAEGTVGICDYAFYGSNLTTINISASVNYIPKTAFNNCGTLFSINVDIANKSFASENGILLNKDKTKLLLCPNAKKDTCFIPTSVTSIEDSAFYDCRKITNITIPTSVNSIGNSAFTYCTNLNSIIIPSTVNYIGDDAFSDCWNLDSIVIPSSVNYVGLSAFLGCYNLSSISFNANVMSINNGTFLYCHKLASFIIPNSVTSIGNLAFCGCKSMTSVIIPSTVTSIGSSAFSGCNSLTTINIPPNINSIEYETFYDCNKLSSITIPASVTSIGMNAFMYCSSLTSIYAYPTIPVDLTEAVNVFYFIDKNNCNLYVPKGSVEAYKSGTKWSEFTHVIGMETSLKNLVMQGVTIKSSIGFIDIYLPKSSSLQVFSITGIQVYNSVFTAGNQRIKLPSGSYIVVVNGFSDKVIVL